VRASSPRRTARGSLNAGPIRHSVAQKVAGDTSIAGVVQSGHFWRQVAEAIARLPDRTFAGCSALSHLRSPSIPPLTGLDEPERKPRPRAGAFTLVEARP
jgi:hypothetical protein